MQKDKMFCQKSKFLQNKRFLFVLFWCPLIINHSSENFPEKHADPNHKPPHITNDDYDPTMMSI